MKKKWSAKNVKCVIAWLEDRWPELFAPGPDRKPLVLDVHKEILKYRAELPALSRRTLDEALKRHMTSHGYLYGMAKYKHRVDLEGNEVEPVSDVHRAWAALLLRKKQKDAQRASKGPKKNVANGNRGKKPAFLDKTHTRKMQEIVEPASSSTPVIRYKHRRRHVVVPAAPVELVS